MSSEQCELFRQLAANFPYQILVAAKCAFCILGASGLGYQWYKQGVRFLVHENTKILFTFYYALNCLLASGNAAIYLFELIRGMMTCVGISAHNIMMLVAFERLYSVLFPATFEKHSTKRVGIFLGSAVIIITWTYTMFGLSDGFTLFGDHTVVFLEDKIPANSHSFENVVIFVRITHLLSPAMFWFDLYLNFIKKKAVTGSSPLSVSYQRSENRRVILVILPIEIAEAALALTTNFAMIFNSKFFDITRPMERIFFVEMLSFPMFFPLIIAIIIEFRVARRIITPATDTYREVDHFEALKLAWR